MVKNTSIEKNKINSVRKISELYKFMTEQNLEELELKDARFFVKLKRKSKKINKQQVLLQTNNLSATQQISPTEVIETTKIKSPLNGIFYQASSPSSQPFVKEGDIVDIGVVLCIVEAMKVMNEIRAEMKCKIIKILVENGQSVTAEQDMFVIQQM